VSVRDLSSLLRALKLGLVALTLMSVGVMGGLLLSTSIRDGRPEPTSTMAAAQQGTPATRGTAEPVDMVPQALLTHPESGADPLQSPFAELARRVLPAVVSIESRKMVAHPPVTGPEGEMFRRLFPDQGGEGGEGDGEIEMPSSGSGFIIDSHGYVFTNDHVVSGSETMTVRTGDGRTFEAHLIGTDPGTDVAVVKMDVPPGDPPLPTLPLGDSDEMRVGDWAIAIGNPLGELEGTLTVGVISAKGRKDLRIMGGGPVYQDFIQTDASINFGNSGGPLVNVRGEVVGINSAVNPTGQGLGFSIPINLVRKVAIELIRTGTVRRGYLGILPQPITAEVREGWEMPGLAGILVGSVEKETPAERSGLKVGDVILEFNRKTVRDVPDFRALVAEAGVGVSVPIRYLRDGREATLQVVLDERPDTPTPPAELETPAPEEPKPAQEHWIGAVFQDIDDELVKSLELDVEEGVVLTELDPAGIAAQAGLRVGDVIREVNRKPVASAGETERALETARKAMKPIVFLMQRGTATTFVSVRPPG
jgi:serine protease Do